jgi:hypothetical protein
MNHTENASPENKENAIPPLLPIFWPMAAAEAMSAAYAELTERNQHFLAEEETLHHVPATANKTRLDLRTGGHIGLFMGSRRLKDARLEIVGWDCGDPLMRARFR